jgi:hypothetical protein
MLSLGFNRVSIASGRCRCWSSGWQCRVDLQEDKVSGERTASSLRPEVSPEDGGSMFLRNVVIYLQIHTHGVTTLSTNIGP